MYTETRDPTHSPPAQAALRQRGPIGDGAPRGRARWWLLMAAGTAAVLVALGWGALALAGLVDEVDNWARDGVPGVVEVDVEGPGELVVRSETPGFVRWGSPDQALEVTVHGPDGEAVRVDDVAVAGDYRVPGITGRAVATFDASPAGNYRVAVEGSEAAGGEFAVGEPLWPGSLRGVIGAMTLGLTGALTAAGGAVGLMVTRRRGGPRPADQHVHAMVDRHDDSLRRTSSGCRSLVRTVGFSALALGLTWAVWIPTLTLLGERGMPLVMLGAFGPAVAAAVMVRSEGGRVRSWLRRGLRFRVPGRWYIAALALPLVEPVLTTIVAVAHGAPLAIDELPARLPLVLVGFVVVLLVGGGQEEFGWRGYLLPRLQSHMGPLAASVLVGALWAVWHLPLFTLGMTGYTYERVPFALYVPILAAGSVAFTWLFNRTGGSIVLVMLLHAAFNSWDGLTPLPAALRLDGPAEVLAQVAIAVGYALVALVLVRTGGARLGAPTARTIERTRTSEPDGV